MGRRSLSLSSLERTVSSAKRARDPNVEAGAWGGGHRRFSKPLTDGFRWEKSLLREGHRRFGKLETDGFKWEKSLQWTLGAAEAAWRWIIRQVRWPSDAKRITWFVDSSCIASPVSLCKSVVRKSLRYRKSIYWDKWKSSTWHWKSNTTHYHHYFESRSKIRQHHEM